MDDVLALDFSVTGRRRRSSIQEFYGDFFSHLEDIVSVVVSNL